MNTEAEIEVLDQFFRMLVEKHRQTEEKYIRKHGLANLTNADIRAVRRIGIGRRERMSHLAKALRLTMGTLTSTVDHLVNKGYVQRWRPEHDRRVVEVSLSEKGLKVFKDIEEGRRRVAVKIFGDLEPGEREYLKDILCKLTQE